MKTQTRISCLYPHYTARLRCEAKIKVGIRSTQTSHFHSERRCKILVSAARDLATRVSPNHWSTSRFPASHQLDIKVPCSRYNDVLLVPFGFSALDDPTNITSVMEFITNAHEQGNIDDPANIQDHNVYVFHGKNDDFVEMKFSVATNQMYTALETKRVESNFTSICGHGMPTLNHGVECNDTWLPGINKCNWMGAYFGTQNIYGDLQAPYGDTPLNGELYEYDQTEFFDGIDGHSLDDVGYIYVPTACKDRETKCRLHIVFHGCFQGRENLGIEYANSTGYNEVGEMNDIIMLYPQVKSNIDLVNPTGCWDGVGYTGDDHMFKTGKQMKIVRSQIERILG